MSDRDAELLERWREGEREAGDVLIRGHYAELFRFVAARVGGQEAVAADLVHATFEIVVRKRDRITAPFRAYMFGVARLKLCEHYRIAPHEAPPAEVAADEHSPPSVLQRAREEDLVARALRHLSLDEQILLDLKDHEGFTRRDIATIVDDGSEAAQNRLGGRINRARAHLRDKVTELEAEGPLRDSTLRKLDSWQRSLRDRFAAAHPTAARRATQRDK